MNRPTWLKLPNADPSVADVRILPLAYQATDSGAGGTALAPGAVLLASQQVELWDEELNRDLERLSFHTAEFVTPNESEVAQSYFDRVTDRAAALRGKSGLTIGLGGEHSVTPALARAAVNSDDLTGLTVVQFDAHADLRDRYEGSELSYACAMRRLTDAGAALLAIGIRSMSREEADYAREQLQVKTFLAHDLVTRSGTDWELHTHLKTLRGEVYVTIDVGVLDCSFCPSTRRPEPGGLTWWNLLKLLKTVLLDTPQCQVVGLDVVETVPMPGTHVNEFTTARLVAKCAAYATQRRTAT